ncbi:MAG: TonB-dependent receptor, partial [Bacteroidota bacterium]
MNHWRYVLLAFLASVSLLSVQGQGSLFVNASYEETSLSDILTKWELEYHLLFSYNETRLKNIKTTISFKSTPLNEALDRLLNPHGLTFEYVSPAHLLIKSDPAPNQLVPKHVAGQQDKPRPKPASQVRTIRGRVLLAHNNQPLPFATIRMLGSTRGATSTEEGIFYLRETLQAGDTLEVRYLGCHPRLIPVTDIPGSNYLKVFMDEKGAHEIEGVVITEGSEQTISVKGGAREITINPEKLGMISGLGEPDVLRGLQMLPGISSLNENAADLYVRGGTPDQNLILLDGMTIYQAGHFFGVIGGFNPRAIQSVSFQRGNFGAKYGGRTSSVLEMTGKPQLTDKAKFGVGLNLMNAHAFAEVPIIDGKSALMIAGRRSATDFFQSPYYQRIFDNVFQQGVIDFDRKRWQHTEGSNIDPTFYFYDTNLKWVFQPTKRDHISASFYKAGDKLNYLFGHQETGYTHQTEDQLDLINQGFSTVWARQWDRDFYSRWSVAQSSYHKDYTFQSLDSTDTFVSQYTHDRQQRIQDLSLKMDQEWRFHPKHAFNFGFHASDYKIRDIESQISIHHNTGPDTTLTRGQAWGSYGEYVLTPGAGLHITAGLRHTFFSLTQQNYWEPRFQLNWQVSDHFSAKAAWGRYAQFMNQVEHRNGFQVGQAFWGLSDSLQRPVSRSQDLSMGLAYENR